MRVVRRKMRSKGPPPKPVAPRPCVSRAQGGGSESVPPPPLAQEEVITPQEEAFLQQDDSRLHSHLVYLFDKDLEDHLMEEMEENQTILMMLLH